MAGASVERVKKKLREESERLLKEDIQINRRSRVGQALVPKEATS